MGVFVVWCNIGTSVRLCFGVSCGIARARSFVCDRGHVVAVAVSCPGRRARRAVAVTSLGVPAVPWLWPWRPPSFRRRRVVATRRRMLVFAMVLAWSI